MSLQDKLLSTIANITGRDRTEITIGDDDICFPNHSLPIDVFFDESSSPCQKSQQLKDYLAEFSIDPENTQKVNGRGESFTVSKIVKLNDKIEPGFYEIKDTSGARACLVFTGDFSSATPEIKLTEYPETVFALCLLGAGPRVTESPSWFSILENIGAFVIYKGTLPGYSISQCGLFADPVIPFSFDWDVTPPDIAKQRKADIPEEAEKAYIAALQESMTPDVAFLKLYRVLEILFAGQFQKEIANAPLSKVLVHIQCFQSTSELDTLQKIINTSSTIFNFSKDNFNHLFNGHKPHGTYSKIVTTWLDISSTTNLPDNIRSHLIYYIRCALTHSKISEKEPFLMGPFSSQQHSSLTILVEDIRNLIQDLIF